jgi:hypothetical protein
VVQVHRSKLDKTILIIMGISIPVVIVVVIFGIMNSIQTTNEVSDVFNADKLLKDLESGKITILQYCEHKISDQQQKICTDYKNKFGLK